MPHLCGLQGFMILFSGQVSVENPTALLPMSGQAVKTLKDYENILKEKKKGKGAKKKETACYFKSKLLQ